MQMRIKGRNLRQLTLDKLGSIVQEKYINSRGEFQDKIYIYIYIYLDMVLDAELLNAL